MRFCEDLQDDHRIAGLYGSAPSRLDRIPGPTSTRDLAAFRRQAYLSGALISGDNLNRQTERNFQHSGDFFGCAQADASQLYRGLGCKPFFHVIDTTGLSYRAGARISYRSAYELVLECVELDALFSKSLGKKQTSLEVA